MEIGGSVRLEESDELDDRGVIWNDCDHQRITTLVGDDIYRVTLIRDLGLEETLLVIPWPITATKGVIEFVTGFDLGTMSSVFRGRRLQVTTDLLREAFRLPNGPFSEFKKKWSCTDLDRMFSKEKAAGNPHSLTYLEPAYGGWEVVIRLVLMVLMGKSKPTQVSGKHMWYFYTHWYVHLLPDGRRNYPEKPLLMPDWAELVYDELGIELDKLQRKLVAPPLKKRFPTHVGTAVTTLLNFWGFTSEDLNNRTEVVEGNPASSITNNVEDHTANILLAIARGENADGGTAEMPHGASPYSHRIEGNPDVCVSNPSEDRPMDFNREVCVTSPVEDHSKIVPHSGHVELPDRRTPEIPHGVNPRTHLVEGNAEFSLTIPAEAHPTTVNTAHRDFSDGEIAEIVETPHPRTDPADGNPEGCDHEPTEYDTPGYDTSNREPPDSNDEAPAEEVLSVGWSTGQCDQVGIMKESDMACLGIECNRIQKEKLVLDANLGQKSVASESPTRCINENGSKAIQMVTRCINENGSKTIEMVTRWMNEANSMAIESIMKQSTALQRSRESVARLQESEATLQAREAKFEALAKEFEAARDRISTQTAEASLMTEQIATLKVEATTEKASTAVRVEELAQGLEASQEEEKKSAARVQELESTSQGREARLEALAQLLEASQEREKKSEAKSEALAKELEEARVRILTQTAEASLMSEQIATLKVEATNEKALAQGLEASQERGKHSAARVQELEATSQELEARLEASQEREKKSEAKSEALAKELEEARVRISTQTVEASCMTKQLATLKVEATNEKALAQGLEASQEREKNLDARVQELEATSQEREAKLEALAQLLEATQGRELKSEAKSEALAKELEEARVRISTQTVEASCMTKQIATLTAEINRGKASTTVRVEELGVELATRALELESSKEREKKLQVTLQEGEAKWEAERDVISTLSREAILFMEKIATLEAKATNEINREKASTGVGEEEEHATSEYDILRTELDAPITGTGQTREADARGALAGENSTFRDCQKEDAGHAEKMVTRQPDSVSNVHNSTTTRILAEEKNKTVENGGRIEHPGSKRRLARSQAGEGTSNVTSPNPPSSNVISPNPSQRRVRPKQGSGLGPVDAKVVNRWVNERPQHRTSVGDKELSSLFDIPPEMVRDLSLFEHQKKGIKWMCSREGNMYDHTNLPMGGILADEQGMGKTVQLLGLMLMHRRQGYPNLIICPKSVMNQWAKELESRVSVKYRFSVKMYAGIRDRCDYTKYDVVICTYSAIRTASGITKNTKDDEQIRRGSLTAVKWLRVILDECQNISNMTTGVSKGVCTLDTEYRWCVSGTPFSNTFSEVYAYSRFLWVPGCCTDAEIQCHRRETNKLENATERYGTVHGLLLPFTLRRTKENCLSLPKKTFITKVVEFDVHVDRVMYNNIAADIRNELKKSRTQRETSRFLTLTLRACQLCLHRDLATNKSEGESWRKATPKDGLEAKQKADLAYKLSWGDPSCVACTICKLRWDDGFVATHGAPCQHLFCETCASEVEESWDISECPADGCLQELSFRSLYSLEDLAPPNEPRNGGDGDGDGDVDFELLGCESNERPVKFKAIIEYLKDIPITGGIKEKAILFSQWPTVFAYMEKDLDEEGIGHARLTGKMSLAQRESALEEFSTKPEVKDEVEVLLLSVKAGGAGLTITAANHVLFLDLSWNPTVEDQAIDRTHRIGQTKEVKVVHFVVKNTIEERIVRRQQAKRTMALKVLHGNELFDPREDGHQRGIGEWMELWDEEDDGNSED